MSEMFGGLGICSLEAVVGKDGKEFIIEVNDCATALLGESQEEDRRNIAELVLQQMEVICPNYLLNYFFRKKIIHVTLN